MQTTLNPKPSDDPHDVVVVAPDIVRVAPANDELSNLLQQAAHYSVAAQTRAVSDLPAGATVPPVDTTFRPAAVGDVPAMGNHGVAVICKGKVLSEVRVCLSKELRFAGCPKSVKTQCRDGDIRIGQGCFLHTGPQWQEDPFLALLPGETL